MTRYSSARTLVAWLPAAVAAAAIGCMPVDAPPVQQSCGATDARIGRTAALATRFHGVSGTARIVDDCTIVIENFNYDGGGLDVRVYGGDASGSFANGVILSDDIRRVGGYRDETLTVKLPVGVTLDDVQSLSIWCLPVATSFGDGVFR